MLQDLLNFYLMAVDIREIQGCREMEGTMHNHEFSSCALDVRVCFIDQAWGKDSWILLMIKRDLFSWDQSGQFRAARPTREGNQSEQGSCFILMASAQSRITIPHTIIDR